jgi:hypothetical protein
MWSLHSWWRGKYQGLRRVVRLLSSQKQGETYNFTHIEYVVSSKVLLEVVWMTDEVDRAKVWLSNLCVYELRCEIEGSNKQMWVYA